MADLPDIVRLDQPESPDRTRALGDLLAETVRALNHATREPGALEDPSDADRLLRDVTTALDRLPQLLEQVRHWLHVRASAGVVGHDQRQDVTTSVGVAERHLNTTSGPLATAVVALRRACAETGHLTGVKGEDDA